MSMRSFFENEDEAVECLINLNRGLILDHQPHIKKYYKVRKLHSEILSSMINYINQGKLPIEEYHERISESVNKETQYLHYGLDLEQDNEAAIFYELFIYKNHRKIPSLTETYIKKQKFKSKDKLKLLEAMDDSFASLYKVIKYETDGYITLQDVFTNKEYKIIDIAMSSIGKYNKNTERYLYTRIIKYDDISFATGLPITFTSKNKRLLEFIKEHDYNRCSSFARCLMLYDISADENIMIKNYTNY